MANKEGRDGLAVKVSMAAGLRGATLRALGMGG
jgi:hypothetical protein